MKLNVLIIQLKLEDSKECRAQNLEPPKWGSNSTYTRLRPNNGSANTALKKCYISVVSIVDGAAKVCDRLHNNLAMLFVMQALATAFV